MAGAKDHLPVRFFYEDMAKDYVMSRSGTSAKVNDALSPPLSILGRLGTSRPLTVTDIPNGVQEKDVLEILSQHGVPQS